MTNPILNSMNPPEQAPPDRIAAVRRRVDGWFDRGRIVDQDAFFDHLVRMGRPVVDHGQTWLVGVWGADVPMSDGKC